MLDDRSLNGVFVNGEKIEMRELDDGDQVTIGRFQLHFLSVTGTGAGRRDAAAGRFV
jgi:pSer/pThr/pTyr-binding forkhead associated (FHA) protein